MSRNLFRQWAIAFAFWTVPALLFTVPALRAGQDLTRTIVTESLPWLIWAVLTPFILAQARRYSLEPGRRARDIAVHIASGAAIGALYGIMSALFALALGVAAPERGVAGMLLEAAFVWLPLGLIFYAALASVGFVLAYQQRLRERDVVAAQLQARLSEARLGALRMQLDPHFLFNTLNTISMHVREGNADVSVRLLARLSDLLRHMLDQRAAHEVPLGTELDYVAKYLEIEGERFGDRLRVTIDVPAALHDALVPNLLLQPLVENAIRHGIAKRADAGRLELRAERAGDVLRIALRNEGAPLPPDFDVARSAGIGLRNTVARLEQLYGTAASVRIAQADSATVAVTVELPWHVAPSAMAAALHPVEVP